MISSLNFWAVVSLTMGCLAESGGSGFGLGLDGVGKDRVFVNKNGAVISCPCLFRDPGLFRGNSRSVLWPWS